ncbi:Retrovirus-related Pol polyprotein from transposon TNT 1-94 [Porphyridium purpureum]|uniref:Retrovirus-related Pol polyprotein from transposon TNT 1-94 n=1 Tax=Porphyridium purpureum TaxID=35688 RepID=A0A5J4YTR5_PORPP|nr:Retrovirus-related Pol polyprotein from transposon TNT 1-94 [Porphyridium purpureum]|eukprot:POR4604..scf227_4
MPMVCIVISLGALLSLAEFGTWNPIPISFESARADPSATFVNAHFIYAMKHAECDVDKRIAKVRLVAAGNNLRDVGGALTHQDVPYAAPASLASLRVTVALAAARGHSVAKLDVTSAYLQVQLGGPPVFVRLPKELPESRDGVYRLEKALYGLERSGADFIAETSKKLQAQGWREVAQSLFVRDKYARYASRNASTGPMRRKGPRTPDVEPAVEEFEESFEDDGRARKVIGALLWLSRTTRPDIARATARVARFVDNWTLGASRLLKRLEEYVLCNPISVIRYPRQRVIDSSCRVIAFSDSDFAGDSAAKARSTSGAAFFLELGGARYLVDWSSGLQRAVSTSSAEAELVALASACKTVFAVLESLPEQDGTKVEVGSDSAAALGAVRRGWSAKLAHARRTQRVCVSWLHDLEEQQGFVFVWVPSGRNAADIFTKSFGPLEFLRKIGLLENERVFSNKLEEAASPASMGAL